MKTHYVIEGAIYFLTEKKERKLNDLYPLYPQITEETRRERLHWIEMNGKYRGTAIIENY
ncbi:MAG: hypothetical protein LBE13_00475 [Bacteroidales bacterium]|jgi:hypothetical protein|nr:hypothetical protein [Bacteroidales bacterium]